MKVTYVVDLAEDLNEEPRFIVKKELWGPEGRKWNMEYKQYLFNPKQKISGKRFVNDEFTSNFVRYI